MKNCTFSVLVVFLFSFFTLFSFKLQGQNCQPCEFDDINNVIKSSQAAAFDINDELYVAGIDLNSLEPQLTVTKFTGGKWKILGNRAITPSNSSVEDMLVADTGEVYIVYTVYDNQDFPTFVLRFSGTNWEVLGEMALSETRVRTASLAIDSSGILHVGYNTELKGNVKRFVNDSWEFVGSPNFTSNSVEWQDIEFDENGNLFYGYSQYFSGAFVEKFNGTSWEIVGNGRVSEGGAIDNQLKIDSAGNLYMLYADIDLSTQTNRQTIKKFTNSSWLTLGSRGFNRNDGFFARLEIGNNDIPYVTYIDQTLENKATAEKFDPNEWQLVGSQGFTLGKFISSGQLVTNSLNQLYFVATQFTNQLGVFTSIQQFDGTNWVEFDQNDSSFETEVTFSEGGQLIISDTNGADSDDSFAISVNGQNLRIVDETKAISVDDNDFVQVDANTIEIPLSLITNGVFFLGEGGNNTMKLSPDLNLSGLGQFLVLNDFETVIDSNGNLQLAGLNVNNGSFDTNGAIIDITQGEAGFSNSILKGIGTFNGPVSLYGDATIAPGTSPGIINTGNLELTSDSTFDAEVNGHFPGTDHDQIKVTGTVSLNSAVLNLIGGYANAPTNVIVLIDNDGTDPVVGTFADLAEGTAVGFGEFSGIISYVAGDGNDVALLGNPIIDSSNLIITEVHYDPSGADSGWEWVEVYNAGEQTIEFDGYFFDDKTASSYNQPNIDGGVLEPGQVAVLFDAENNSANDFANAWGENLNLIAVNDWPSLNSTGGDSIGLWDSFENYEGDNQNQTNTISQLTYKVGEEDWPGNLSGKSIFLTNLEFDNTDGTSWMLSNDGVADAYKGGGSAIDVGSPGIVPLLVVEDTEAPEITCPDTVTMTTEEDSCDASFPLSEPTATDNVSETFEFEGVRSDNLELTDPFPVGETTITWTAIDEAENVSEPCDQIIRVNDEENPMISCSDDISIIGSGPEMVEITLPTVTDNCTTEPTVTLLRSDDATLTLEDPFPQGETIITWTALDEANNMSTCSLTVTISMGQSMENDIANFGIPNQLPGTNIDPIEKTVSLVMPLNTNLNGLIPNISVSSAASVSPETGEPQDFSVPVIYTVTAEDGSVQEWTVSVEIEEDEEPPVLVCPIDIVVNNDPGECGAIVEFRPTATDNSGSVIVSADFMTGVVFPVGTTLVTVTATDPSDNISTCTFNVIVNDHENPVAVCQPITLMLDSEGNATLNPAEVDGGSTDNCGIAVISISPLSFGVENVGENEVEVVVIDDNGNIDSCIAIVTVMPFESNSLAVTSFTLINADTDEPIRDLVEGETIDINSLPTLHLDIRANTAEGVESVRISLAGALTNSRTESLMPFALFRDLPVGDYIGEDFIVGEYEVSAIPYSEDGLRGEMGEPLSLNFELIDSTPTLSVTSFTLINADTDEPLFDLIQGDTINIESLPTLHLDILANTTDDVESVRLSLSGELMTERTESLIPFALFQDLPIGDYKGADFVAGDYSVSASPYSQNGLGGDMGTPLTVDFVLFDGSADCTNFDPLVDGLVHPSVCDGFGGLIELQVLNFQAPLTFAWEHDSNLNGPLAQNLAAGTYMVTVTDGNNCMKVLTATLNDPELPEVSLEPFNSVLNTDIAFSLSGGMPAGGDYTGPGINNCIFDPQVVGPGTYEITYTYIDNETQCSNSATQEITVTAESFNSIVAYWLVNADTEEDLFPITDGMQIDITDLPTTNLDIRAEAGGDTESVGFELSGTQSIMRGESVPPYALFQDLPIGDYIGHAFDLGEYSLSGTPYTENSLRGNAGESLTIDFEFVDLTPTLAVTSFSLIDAETDLPIDIPLVDGAQFTLEQIGTLFLDIRANTTDDVESVRLELTGAQTSGRTENLVPYALFQDLPIGDYRGNNFEFGEYTVTATPYSGDNLTGEMGAPFSITFEIVDDLELNTFNISPNQATTLARASFERPTEINQILIFDMAGRLIESYNPEYIKSGDDYILDVNFYQQGSYIVKMLDNRGVHYQKQMLVKR